MLFKNTLILYKKNFYEIECFVQKKNIIQEYTDIVNCPSARRKEDKDKKAKLKTVKNLEKQRLSWNIS